MTLETLYYLTQILAVLGVIGSLIFVGVQVKQNTEQTRVQNSAHLQDRHDNWWRMVGEDAELAYAYTRLFKGEKIDPRQAAQLAVFCNMMANISWTAYIAEKQGTGTGKLAGEAEVHYARMITNPLLFSAHKRLLGTHWSAEIEGIGYDRIKMFDRDYYFTEWLNRVEKLRADMIANREALSNQRGDPAKPQEEAPKEEPGV